MHSLNKLASAGIYFECDAHQKSTGTAKIATLLYYETVSDFKNRYSCPMQLDTKMIKIAMISSMRGRLR